MTPENLTVWAPDASRVDVLVTPIVRSGSEPTSATERHAMTAAEGGWWSWPRPDEVPLDHALGIDAGDRRPDPRSAWLPHGVHAASRTFDATAYDWGDDGWSGTRGGRGVLGGVVYELHVGTFTPEGTLDAAAGHLSHLVDLGVDVVEVMPVAAFGGTHGWGYDGVAPYAVQHSYGGPAAFQRFVDACHTLGIGV